MAFRFTWFPPHDQSFYRNGWLRDALIADPAQPNAELAKLLDVDRQFVMNTRRALERIIKIRIREKKKVRGYHRFRPQK